MRFELADRRGFDGAWCVEHGHGMTQPPINHPPRVAEQDEDIVGLTPAELKANMAAKEHA